MPKEGVTGLENLGFVKFNFRFTVHVPLQIHEVVHCQKRTCVVTFSQVCLGEYC